MYLFKIINNTILTLKYQYNYSHFIIVVTRCKLNVYAFVYDTLTTTSIKETCLKDFLKIPKR